MKVIARGDEGIKVAPETLDDLWHLSHLVDKGDRVKMWTYRTREVKEEKLRNEKMSKVRVELTLEVEDVEFALFADRLRIRGPIVAGAQDLGSYHTFTVEADGQTDLWILKPAGFKPHHEERLKEAVESAKRPLVTILCIDDEDATIAVLRPSGVQPIGNVRGRTGGKMFKTDDGNEGYFGETLAALRRARPQGSPLIVVGPGFTRDAFIAFVRARDAPWLPPFITEGVGQSGMVGVQEALKRGIVERIQKDQQIASDTILVEEIFAQIGRDGAVAYGLTEVQNLIDAGAVKLLVLSDELLRTPVGEELLEQARRSQSKSHVVATTHEAGKKLQGLGGVAAILRYKPTA